MARARPRARVRTKATRSVERNGVMQPQPAPPSSAAGQELPWRAGSAQHSAGGEQEGARSRHRLHLTLGIRLPPATRRGFRNCAVTPIDTSARGQPLVALTTLKKTGGRKTDAPPEESQDKSSANYPPSMERARARRLRRHAATLLAASRRCYGHGRSRFCRACAGGPGGVRPWPAMRCLAQGRFA